MGVSSLENCATVKRKGSIPLSSTTKCICPSGLGSRLQICLRKFEPCNALNFSLHNSHNHLNR